MKHIDRVLFGIGVLRECCVRDQHVLGCRVDDVPIQPRTYHTRRIGHALGARHARGSPCQQLVYALRAWRTLAGPCVAKRARRARRARGITGEAVFTGHAQIAAGGAIESDTGGRVMHNAGAEFARRTRHALASPRVAGRAIRARRALATPRVAGRTRRARLALDTAESAVRARRAFRARVINRAFTTSAYT